MSQGKIFYKKYLCQQNVPGLPAKDREGEHCLHNPREGEITFVLIILIVVNVFITVVIIIVIIVIIVVIVSIPNYCHLGLRSL